MIQTFVFNPFQENTYVVFDDTKECVIVDAGCYSPDEQQMLVSFIERNGLMPKFLISTHGHVDHVLGNSFVKSHFNVPVAAHANELALIEAAPLQANLYGFELETVPEVDTILHHNDEIKFGNTTLKVLHTPGHSQGGICLFSPEHGFLLSGDSLFRSSIGRTDLPGGDYDELIDSIQSKLLVLDPQTKVYPGHGDPTTIGWEKMNNPFLVGL